MDTARTSWLPGRPSASGGAGLVLLYAPNHEAIPNARDIPPGGIIIGRDPPADGLVIPQGAVSRNHARISLELEGWTIADLGSRNGVVVNGRLVQRTRLANGDVVLFASTKANLDVFHCGFLVLAGGSVRLRHASRSAGRVVEEDLARFLAANRMAGVIAARPLDVATAGSGGVVVSRGGGSRKRRS